MRDFDQYGHVRMESFGIANSSNFRTGGADSSGYQGLNQQNSTPSLKSHEQSSREHKQEQSNTSLVIKEPMSDSNSEHFTD